MEVGIFLLTLHFTSRKENVTPAKVIAEIHEEMFMVIGWINKDLPTWLKTIDRFEETKKQICSRMNWNYENQ